MSVDLECLVLCSVPEEPRSVHVETINSTAISVRWRPPDGGTDYGTVGLIRGYHIFYGPESSTSNNNEYYAARNDYYNAHTSGSAMTYDVIEPAKTEVEISGLTPDTTYSVEVAAYTRKGDGRRSRSQKVTTKGAGKFLSCPTFGKVKVAP